MVGIDEINNSLEKSILKTELSEIIEKRFLDIVKCTDNSATRRGEGAEIHMANDPDGMKVPKRLLQHKGFDDEGNDLGYIADISYPDGTKIDYYHGKITLDGIDYDMSMLDNFTVDSNGNMNHKTKGSANGMFKRQWTEANRQEKSFALNYSSLLGSGSLVNIMEEMSRSGVELNRWSVKADAMSTNPKLGKLLTGLIQFESIVKSDTFSADGQSIVCGEQVSTSSVPYGDRFKINYSKNTPTNTSVGRLNDSTLNAHDTITGESRSINGKNNNWDNTLKFYTLVTEGDGTHAMYLGYPQNVKAGVWDNSANSQNGLSFSPNQQFKRVLCDKKNGIVIQVPVNE